MPAKIRLTQVLTLNTEGLHYAVVFTMSGPGEPPNVQEAGSHVMAIFSSKKDADAYHAEQCPNVGLVVELAEPI